MGPDGSHVHRAHPPHKVVVLPRHRPQTAHLPEPPLQAFISAPQILWNHGFRLIGQLQKNGPGLENTDGVSTAFWMVVNDGRNSVIGRNLQELRGKLFTFADVDRLDPVVQPCFLQKHRDLVTVRCGPVIKINHV